MKRGVRKIAILSVVLAAGCAAFAACANYGEGERCEYLNGNDDCKTGDGLVCYRAADLNNTTSDRCCPLDRATASHPVCTVPLNVGGSDAAAPADTGPPETVPDATAGTDAGVDGSADAGDGGDGG